MDVFFISLSINRRYFGFNYCHVDIDTLILTIVGIYQFGNSLHFGKPWKKGVYGQKKFTDIINSIGKSDAKTIQSDLLNLLSDDYKLVFTVFLWLIILLYLLYIIYILSIYYLYIIYILSIYYLYIIYILSISALKSFDSL